MDFRTPCQILLGFLLTAVALSVLGLAANNVSYVNNHHNSPVAVHFTQWNQTAQMQYSYWVTMDYVPSRLNMGNVYAMLAVSVVCSLVGVEVVVSSWIVRGQKVLDTSFWSMQRGKRSLPFLPITLVLTTVAFLTTFALAIYVWYPVKQWPLAFGRHTLPLPASISEGAAAGPFKFQSPFDTTSETWNCFLAGYAIGPGESARLQGLCHEARIAEYLMVPVLILSAAVFFCLLCTWRKARLAAACDLSNAEAKQMEEVDA